MRLSADRLLRQWMLVLVLLASLAPTASRVLAASGMLGDWQPICTASGMHWVLLDDLQAASASGNGGSAPATPGASSGPGGGSADMLDCPLCLVAAHGGFMLPATPLQAQPVQWVERYALAAASVSRPFIPHGIYRYAPPLRAPPVA